MIKEDLRPVTFKDSYDKSIVKELFHQWSKRYDYSDEGGYREITVAIIERIDDGKVVLVFPEDITFDADSGRKDFR